MNFVNAVPFLRDGRPAGARPWLCRCDIGFASGLALAGVAKFSPEGCANVARTDGAAVSTGCRPAVFRANWFGRLTDTISRTHGAYA